MSTKFGILLKNEYGKMFLPISTDGIIESDIRLAEHLFSAKIKRADYRDDDKAVDYLFNHRDNTSALALGIRVLFGGISPHRNGTYEKGKGHVNLVMITDDCVKHKVRLYDMCPDTIDSGLVHAFTGGTSVVSFEVKFEKCAMAGHYNDLTDEEYKAELVRVKGISSRYFSGKPSLPAFELVIRYAEYAYLHNTMHYTYDAIADDLDQLKIAISGVAKSDDSSDTSDPNSNAV